MEFESILGSAREPFINMLDTCRILRTFTPSEIVGRTGLRLDQVQDLITASEGCFVQGSVDGYGEQCYFISNTTEPALNSLLAALRHPIS